MATSASTTKKAPSRIMDTDPKTGRRYVKTTTVEGATVTAVKFTGVLTGDKYSWSSATYDVTSPAGQLFAASIKWDGKTFKVGTKPAPSLGKAVRAVLGIEELPAPKPKTDKAPAADKAPAPAGSGATPKGRTRKSAADRKAEKAAADAAKSGSSVVETDPETGLPRIKPEVAAKADAIVADQLAKNEQADADAQAQYEADQAAAQDAAIERITSGETTVEGEVIDILTKKGTK